MKRVLITGGSGMVGKNLLEHPLAEEYEVLSPTSNELNLSDFETLNRYLISQQPDLIVHAAGKVGGIQANINDPVGYLDQNLLIGRNIIIAALQNGVKNFLNLGSTCMYPRGAANPLSETAILTGSLEPTNEGYALAKIMTSKLCDYITRQNSSLNYKTIVPCNIYGRFDKFSPHNSHLIPAIIHKIHAAKIAGSEAVEIWGDGNARREFMYAGDLSSAIWKAVAEIQCIPSLFNCGLGYDYSINQYYAAVSEVIGWNGNFVHNLDKPVGMMRKLSDISLQRAWGFSPATALSEGLRQTYAYYLDNQTK